ncbi:hypothetical protein HZA57_08850 [Candidatus Poribacteria bacterium]|nr:hypothetical protein [Candidatus Poribacteria bacterium]
MPKSSINYLFPPDQIGNLPTWRLILHFKTPLFFRDRKLSTAAEGLRGAAWEIVQFPQGFESLPYDPQTRTVAVAFEVPESSRARSAALADLESDIWKIIGHMLGAGFGDVYYESVDWTAAHPPG